MPPCTYNVAPLSTRTSHVNWMRERYDPIDALRTLINGHTHPAARKKAPAEHPSTQELGASSAYTVFRLRDARLHSPADAASVHQDH